MPYQRIMNSRTSRRTQLPKRKPRIALTIGTARSWKTGDAASYRIAIEEAGGIPVIIEPGTENRLSDCSGIIFSGGRDIHPQKMKLRPQDEGLSVDEYVSRYSIGLEPARDDYELPLAEKVFQEKMPVLGICRGYQLLNVARGGSLVPDIPACLPNPIKHRYKKEDGPALHQVEVISGSYLAGICGSGSVTVNTYHHQGVTDAELAVGLEAMAYTPDGLVEAFADPMHPFLVAVQWHPERRKDPEVKERFRKLFEDLVSTAGR